MSESRPSAPVETPVVVTIAGSDSGGGAGIQADIKTVEAGGAFCASVVTAVTAQNTTGVTSTHVLPVEEIEAQLEAVLVDFDVAAVKTGMLATAEVVELVTEHVAGLDTPLVVDPVMVAASGDRLLAEAAEAAYEDLIAEATVVTPNADEAEVLTDVEVAAEGGARLAGQRLLSMGADAALVKGGHVPGEEVRDVLVTPDTIETATHPRIDTDASHGSGCMLASAIATRLAQDEPLVEAVGHSVAGMETAVRYHHDVGAGPGAVHHLLGLRNEAARHETAESVRDIVEWFVDRDVSPLVPEVGMNVVGALPYAETTGEVAAVDGRLSTTVSGVAPTRGVRFGASSHVARFLLAAREYHPELRYAVNARFDADVEAALDTLEGPVADYDRADEPDTASSTMAWAAGEVFDRDPPPVAVVDPGAHGKEPITKFVGRTPQRTAERLVAVLEAL